MFRITNSHNNAFAAFAAFAAFNNTTQSNKTRNLEWTISSVVA